MDTYGKWRGADGKWEDIRKMPHNRLWFAARYLAEHRLTLVRDANKMSYVHISHKGERVGIIPLTKSGTVSDGTIENAILMDDYLRTAGCISPLTMEYIEPLPVPMESITTGHVLKINPKVVPPLNGDILEPTDKDGWLWFMVSGTDPRAQPGIADVTGSVGGKLQHWRLVASEVLAVQRYRAGPIHRGKSTVEVEVTTTPVPLDTTLAGLRARWRKT